MRQNFEKKIIFFLIFENKIFMGIMIARLLRRKLYAWCNAYRKRVNAKVRNYDVRAHPLAHSDGGCHPSLTGYPPNSQGFLSPPWARTWDHELRYPFEVVPTTNWASSSVGSGNYLEWVSKLMIPGSSPRRRKKPL